MSFNKVKEVQDEYGFLIIRDDPEDDPDVAAEVSCMLKGYASYQLDETDRQVANSENPTEPVLYDENPDDMESFEPPRGQTIPSSIMARKRGLEDEMCDYE